MNCLICPFESIRSHVSLKINQLDIKCDTKTKDNVFVSVNVAVLYKVNPAEAVDAYYKLTDHRSQMRYVNIMSYSIYLFCSLYFIPYLIV